MARLFNGLRRVAAGLPPSSEAVWPGVANDLFVAHASVYLFARRLAKNKRVLDAACGTGYGSALLAAETSTVVGVDLDRRRVNYASSRYQSGNLCFVEQDCLHLDFVDCFDLIVSSNTLEHLADPASFLAGARRALTRDGNLLVAVPPILSEADLAANRVNRFHVNNFSVRQWAEYFASEGFEVRFFTHRCRRTLDFTSPFRSAVRFEDFEFREAPVDNAYREPSISAIYLLRPVGPE